MSWLFFSLAVLMFTGLLSLIIGHRARLCSLVSATACSVSAVVGAFSCINMLFGAQTETFSATWQIPLGSFSLVFDALSALFLLPIYCLSALAAVYGTRYLDHWAGKKFIGLSWFFFHVLCASMILVVLSANGLLFLLAWEATVLSSFFLVTFEHEHAENRRAGWIYLIASHFGTAFLIVFFLLLDRETGSLDFRGLAQTTGLAGTGTGLLFILALIGFGTKAGFIPFHVWLPEAHPAAPSHVSALMSGVMIKTGIYGILRVVFLLGHPPLWWGWMLLVVGLLSGILGALFALTQSDLKRLLAYSTVENAGIIAIGLSLGLLGLSTREPLCAVLGFAGAFLHVINHSVFKGLLFLCAGAVVHQTGTRDMNQLGGLSRGMPWTSNCFLIGSAAISGLPPLNGFVSEFVIYLGALYAITSTQSALVVPALLIIVGLALIGGLAAACFAGAFSVIFLGAPRRPRENSIADVTSAMRWPMMILATLCPLIALSAPFILRLLSPVLTLHPELPKSTELLILLHQASGPLTIIVACSVLLCLVLAFVLSLRKRLLFGRAVTQSVTWDCGYAQPSPSMQYSSSSFAQPLTSLFSPLLRMRTDIQGIDGLFPAAGDLRTHAADLFHTVLFRPAFASVLRLFQKLDWIQIGVVQVYILYIALTLAGLLIWGLF